METTFQTSPRQRVGIFVDVLNMFYSAKLNAKSKVDYSKLLKKLTDGRELVRAIAYIIQHPDTKQEGFQIALSAMGYELRIKEIKTYMVSGKQIHSKSRWDVGMTVDALTMAAKLDVIILVTGDGDFLPLVENLKQLGCKVEVASLERSISHELKNAADRFIPIVEDCMFKEKKFEDMPEPKEGVKVVAAGDAGGFGILGNTSRDAVDFTGLPEDEPVITASGGTLEPIKQ